MSESIEISQKEVDRLHEKLNREAEEGGYHLNPDKMFTKELINGLLINEKRYGYWSCPCRLAEGNKEKDLDIICPCDYRDPDLNQYHTCYCGLYVSQAVMAGEKKIEKIPERRPPEEKRRTRDMRSSSVRVSGLPVPVWRCKVCGYLCARDEPPGLCPVCKAKKERFEKFMEKGQ